MKYYCIDFMRQTDDDNTEHKFFVYAKSILDAEKRFCEVTGYKSYCIISIHRMEQ